MLIGIFLLLLVTTTTWAQETSNPQVKWASAPIAELQKLAFLVGTWQANETVVPNPVAKSGGHATGSLNVRFGPGRNSLLLDYRSTGTLGNYESHRVIFWDKQTASYRTLYCDSLNPIGCGEHRNGSFRNGDLSFGGVHTSQSGEVSLIETFKPLKANEMEFSVDVEQAGKPAKTLIIRCKKTGAKKPTG